MPSGLRVCHPDPAEVPAIPAINNDNSYES